MMHDCCLCVCVCVSIYLLMAWFNCSDWNLCTLELQPDNNSIMIIWRCCIYLLWWIMLNLKSTVPDDSVWNPYLLRCLPWEWWADRNMSILITLTFTNSPQSQKVWRCTTFPSVSRPRPQRTSWVCPLLGYHLVSMSPPQPRALLKHTDTHTDTPHQASRFLGVPSPDFSKFKFPTLWWKKVMLG